MENSPISKIEYLIPVISGTLLFALLISFVVYFILLYRKSHVKFQLEREQLKQELLRIENEVKEQTLIHVSRELHDNLGQIASLIKINLNMMSQNLSADDLERVNESLILIRQLIGDIKTLSASLSGETLHKKGWIATIEEDLRRIHSLGGLKVDFRCSGTYQLHQDKEVILYRIIQEVLNNTLKHSKATEAQLFIASEDNDLSIQFSDNGVGFDFDTVVKGSGLSNIEARCKMIQAEVEIRSAKDAGTQIQIKLHGSNE